MRSNLYELLNYITPIKYLNSVIITEYDISKANINALYQSGVIDNIKYNYLCMLPKGDRERAVGKMIEYDTKNIVYNTIQNNIVEAKRMLFLKNNLSDNEIIRIANDAVYVMRSVPLQYTDFGMMKFIPKGRYTSFLNLENLVILFSSTMDDLNIDVIGMDNRGLKEHSEYMLTFIANLLQLAESSTLDVIMKYFNEFYSLYINNLLSIEYYREFNANSMYTIKQTYKRMSYKVSYINKKDKDKIDINYNANLLRDLYSIIASTYKTR